MNIIQDSAKDVLSLQYWILQHLEQSSGIMFVRNLREIEDKYFDDLLAVTMKKILLVAPLVRDPITEDDKKPESTSLSLVFLIIDSKKKTTKIFKY